MPLSPLAQMQTVGDACGPEETMSLVCQWVFEQTGSPMGARLAEWVVAKPLMLALVVIAAWLATRTVHRMIGRSVRRVTGEAVPRRRRRTVSALLDVPADGRRRARAEAVGAVLRSVATGSIWGVAALVALGELGIELAPLIAGAGVVGIAIGFGAQSLVRDFLAGIFMLAEDQFGVGDIVDLGEATGTVEGISLRVTRVRDVHGHLWHVPNGEIHRVSNRSQAWARALLDIQVAYDTDIDWASKVIKRVADDLWKEEEYRLVVLEEPELWGVETLGADGVALRLVVKTQPLAQWQVARELRRRIKLAFDAEGIEIPFPQQTVWLRDPGAAENVAAGSG